MCADALGSLPPLRDIVRKYNLSASKTLGQNFLFDLNLTDKIARLAGDLSTATVVEVGPGPGGLTRSLLRGGVKKLIAIEKDPACVAALKDYLVPAANGRLEVIEADALTFDWGCFNGQVKIVANLPYNIATELLFLWLGQISHFSRLVLMFQREVAMRINASPNSKDYGRLSVKTQWLCDVEHGFDIAPQAFYPPPKVTSSVLRMTPYAQPLFPADEEILGKLCKATFGQRRKALRASLKQLTGQPEAVLKEVAIDGLTRPEQLSVEQFCALARALAAQIK